MTPAIVVPYLPSGPDRAMAWAYVRDRLSRMYPAWPILEVWEGSKARSVNQGALRASADVLVLHDADSFVRPDVLHKATIMVATGAAHWVVPHGAVYRLSRQATAGWITGRSEEIRLARGVYQGPAGGGIVVLSRAAFDAVHGMDERFTEWGWEDQAFGKALSTMVGSYRRLEADLLHLWHPPANPTRKPSPAMTALHREYKAALYNPRLMRAVLTGQEPEPWVPLEQPRHFLADTPSQVVRYGGKAAHFRDGRLSTRDPDLAAAMRCYEHVREVTEGC